jgi:FkbM family methyltransferase
MRSLTEAVGWRSRLLVSPTVWSLATRTRRGVPHSWTPPVAHQESDEGKFSRWVVDGRRYWLPLDQGFAGLQVVYEEVFREGNPHYYTHKACDITPEDVVVDAGASEGFFTEFALRRGARVLIVEPSSIYVEALARTFADEIDSGHVHVRRALLGASDEKVQVTVHPCGWVTDEDPGDDPGFTTEWVDQITLDTLAEDSPFGALDFIKMDVEGAERDAIRGGTRMLRRWRPRLSLAVYHHPTGFLDLRRDLRKLSLNYRVEAKGTQRHRGFPIPTMLHAWPERTAAD